MKQSIYVLTSIMPIENRHAENEDDREYNIDEDGNIDVYRERVGCFSTVENAESAMKKLIANLEKESARWTKYSGFLVEELYLDDALYGYDYAYASSFESVRSYTGLGDLIYFSDVDERCEKKFGGGDNPEKYVKSGDYALFLSNNRLIPILVDSAAFSKKEWSEKFRPGVFGDFTDDCGLAFRNGFGHLHPMWSHVFPMSVLEFYSIPEDLKTALDKERDEYHNGK